MVVFWSRAMLDLRGERPAGREGERVGILGVYYYPFWKVGLLTVLLCCGGKNKVNNGATVNRKQDC